MEKNYITAIQKCDLFRKCHKHSDSLHAVTRIHGVYMTESDSCVHTDLVQRNPHVYRIMKAACFMFNRL